MKSYSELIALYGQERFTAACAEAKHSPLSVEEILARGTVVPVAKLPTRKLNEEFSRLLSV